MAIRTIRARITFMIPGRPTRFDCLGPLRCDQSTVPAHDRVRGHDGRDPGEEAPSKRLSLGSESSSLFVGQAESLLAELFLEDTVLLNEVLDGLILMTVDPAGERREEELKAELVSHDADRTGGT